MHGTMAPSSIFDLSALHNRSPDPLPETTTRTSPPTRGSLSTEGGLLEAWAQGYNVGSLLILILIVFCNYRSGIWLHKLILLEVGTNHHIRCTIVDHCSWFSLSGTEPSSSSKIRTMAGTSQLQLPCSSSLTFFTILSPGSRFDRFSPRGALDSSSSHCSASSHSGLPKRGRIFPTSTA